MSLSLSKRRYVARIRIQSADYADTAVCVVIRRNPFTILVPSHAITALEDGLARSIHVDGVCQTGPEILPSAHLEREHLSLLRFSGRAPAHLGPTPLPMAPPPIIPGQTVSLNVPPGDPPGPPPGTLLETRLQGSQVTLCSSTKVAPGLSGSPLLVRGRLCGICVGRDKEGHAMAVRLSHTILRELRRIRFRVVSAVVPAIVALLILGLLLASARVAGVVLSAAMVLLLVRSWTSFTLGGVEGPPNHPSPRDFSGSTITASNGQALSVRRSWSRTFETSIGWWTFFPGQIGGKPDHVVAGTRNEEGIPAYVTLLDKNGRIQWRYTLPDGECVYNADECFNGYHVYRVFAADLTGDGQSEIIALFIHNNWYPSKAMVFRLDGTILGEYWHPGYLRTAGVGYVGDEKDPLLVLTGCNNRFRHGCEPINPRVVMAFRGAHLRGQAPPYTGRGPAGNELWYALIPSVIQGTEIDCSDTLFADSNGDGLNEIRLKTADGRYYYLDANGQVLRTDVGDDFLLRYGHGDLPDLQPIELRRRVGDKVAVRSASKNP